MLEAKSEPSPRARMWALRILGRHGGFGLEGLVRHSLGDPAPEVRPVAADVMLDLAKTAPAASAAALLALGIHATDDDLVLAAAARAAVVDLTGAELAPADPDTEPGRRAAFLTWWRGPSAREAKITALARVGELQDPRADQLIVPYLHDPDAFVMTAAWRALAKEGPRLARLPKTSAAVRAWLGGLPPPPKVDPAPGQDGEARARINAWVAKRPK